MCAGGQRGRAVLSCPAGRWHCQECAVGPGKGPLQPWRWGLGCLVFPGALQQGQASSQQTQCWSARRPDTAGIVLLPAPGLPCQPSTGTLSRLLRGCNWTPAPSALWLQVQRGCRRPDGWAPHCRHSPAGPGTVRPGAHRACPNPATLCSSELGWPSLLPPSPCGVGWRWPGPLPGVTLGVCLTPGLGWHPGAPRASADMAAAGPTPGWLSWPGPHGRVHPPPPCKQGQPRPCKDSGRSKITHVMTKATRDLDSTAPFSTDYPTCGADAM